MISLLNKRKGKCLSVPPWMLQAIFTVSGFNSLYVYVNCVNEVDQSFDLKSGLAF